MEKSRRTTTEQHRVKLVEYLADPENEFPSRSFLASNVLGFKNASVIYRHFTPAELDQIEAEALELRRRRYVRSFAAVDSAMIAKAKDGDPVAAKLIYQRLEGWNPAQKVESKVEVSGELTLADILGGENGEEG